VKKSPETRAEEIEYEFSRLRFRKAIESGMSYEKALKERDTEPEVFYTPPKIRPTSREFEVAAVLAVTCGTSEDIGKQLGMSAGTVKQHVHHLHQKYGTKTRGQLFMKLRKEFDADA
jgi:DNA-binding NarL/FixJ family response regulator